MKNTDNIKKHENDKYNIKSHDNNFLQEIMNKNFIYEDIKTTNKKYFEKYISDNVVPKTHPLDYIINNDMNYVQKEDTNNNPFHDKTDKGTIQKIYDLINNHDDRSYRKYM